MINLPEKDKGRIRGYYNSVDDSYHITTIMGDKIIDIGPRLRKETIAEDIAIAIEYARDIGFNQGVASIRKALGFKDS